LHLHKGYQPTMVMSHKCYYLHHLAVYKELSFKISPTKLINLLQKTKSVGHFF